MARRGTVKLTITSAFDDKGTKAATKALEGFQAKAEKMQASSAAADALAKASIQADRLSGNLEKAGGKLTDLGDSYTKSVTAPIAATAAASMAAAVKIDSALTGVKKTVDMTAEEYEALKDAALDYSKTNAVKAEDILAAEELGGQLGIAKDNLQEFAEITTGLDIATNMDVEQASTNLARFANITRMSADDYRAYGNVIVGLGNNLATTESEISDMSMRIASAGTQAGMTQPQIMGIAGALSSLGMEAEAGGSAVSTVITNIDKAVATGGESLSAFAEVAGMSAEQFAEAWKGDAAGAFEAFLGGLSQAENMNVTLDELGVTELRQSDALRRLAGNTDLLGNAVQLANEQWKDGSALSDEVANKNDSMAAKWQMLQNRVTAVAEEVGGPLVDAALDAVDAASPVIQSIEDGAKAFSDLSKEEQAGIVKNVAMAASLGPVLSIGGRLVSSTGKVAGGFAKCAAKMAEWTVKAKAAAGGAKGLGAAMAVAKTGAGNLATKLASLGPGAAAAVAVAGIALFASTVVEARARQKEFSAATDGLRDALARVPNAATSAGDSVAGISGGCATAAASLDAVIKKQAEWVQTLNDRADETAAGVQVLEGYGDAIERLAGRSDLSASELADLQLAVDGVNDKCGTSYTVAQDAGGAYQVMADGATVAKEEILKLVEAQEYQLQLDASKSSYEEGLQRQTDAADALAAAQKKLQETTERNADAWKRGADAASNAAIENAACEAEVRNAQAAYDAATAAVDGYGEKMTIAKMAMEGMDGGYAALISSNQLLQSTLAGNGTSLEAFRAALADTGVSAETFASLNDEQLAQLASSYDGTTQSIIDTLSGFGITVMGSGQAAGANFAAGLSSETQAAVNAALTVTGMSQSEFDAAASAAGVSGDAATAAFAKAISAKGPAAKWAAQDVRGKAESGLDGADSYSKGQDFTQGFANGIGSLVGRVAEAARNMARSAIDAAKREQDSASPSKETRKLGDWFAQGYALNIEAGAADAAAAARTMAAAALDAAEGPAPEFAAKPAYDGGTQTAAARQADTREAQAQAVRDAHLAEVRDLLATMLATMEDMLDGGLAVKSRGREIARLVADA